MAAKKTAAKKKPSKPAPKRMGRPPRADSGAAGRAIVVRLTDAEHGMLKAAAAAAGTTMAALLRDSAFSVIRA